MDYLSRRQRELIGEPRALISEHQQNVNMKKKSIELLKQIIEEEERPAPIVSSGMFDEVEKDAREWGSALNSAGWKFDEMYQAVIGEPTSAKLFNGGKTIIREVILTYLKEVQKNR